MRGYFAAGFRSRVSRIINNGHIEFFQVLLFKDEDMKNFNKISVFKLKIFT